MNKKLTFILIITLFALSFSVFQYVKEFQSEIADAAYSSKPAVGHSWTEMECSEGLCVTAGNKVGIGTSTPAQKLEVSGSILVSGTGADVCTSSGACLSQIASFISSQPLINNVHNYSACTSAGGEIISIGASYPLCRFSAASNASCPNGWTQYQNWSTTTSKSECWNCGCATYCYATESHNWSNAAQESGSWTSCPCNGGGWPWTLYATVTQVGCY